MSVWDESCLREQDELVHTKMQNAIDMHVLDHRI